MDGQSLSSEKSDNYLKFLKYSRNWTLKQDIKLKDALQGTVSVMLDAIRHFDTVGKALESEMDLFECRLENIHSRIGCMKMERLVKEQVDEVPLDLLRGRSHKSRDCLTRELNREEYEQRTINTISKAIRRGFEVFNNPSQNEQKRQPNQLCNVIDGSRTDQCGDPSNPSSSTSLVQNNLDENDANAWGGLKILRSIALSEMPPIIGTAEFYTSLWRATDTSTTNMQRMGDNGPTLSVSATTKIEEEDIASVSSGRSAPPQDPVVQQTPSIGTEGAMNEATLTMRTVLIEEIGERAQKREDNRKNEMGTVGEKQRTIGRRGETEDFEDQQRMMDGMAERRQGDDERAAEKRSIRHNQLVTERTEECKRYEERQGIRDDARQRQITTARRSRGEGEQRVKRSLFSSSSSEEEEEEGGKASQISAILKTPFLEKSKPLTNEPGSSSSGRSVSQRPLSAQSVGSSAGDDELFSSAAASRSAAAARLPALVRKTESTTAVSVVSNNEEFGPTSVKNRIAQIGAQIPMGRRATDGGGREEQGAYVKRSNETEQRMERRSAEATKMVTPTTPAASLPTEAIKTRAKAPPARRAPSQRTYVRGKPPLPSSIASPSAGHDEAITTNAPPHQKQQRGEREAEEKRPISCGTSKENADNIEQDTGTMMVTNQRTSSPSLDTHAKDKQQQLSKQTLSSPHSTMPMAKALKGSGGGCPPQSAPRKTTENAVVSPPVKPKATTTKRSIFSSSSSDDDLGFSKVIGTTKERLPALPPQPHKKNEVVRKANVATMALSPKQQHPPPFSYKKTSAADSSKARKGLFDDSESDF